MTVFYWMWMIWTLIPIASIAVASRARDGLGFGIVIYMASFMWFGYTMALVPLSIWRTWFSGA